MNRLPAELHQYIVPHLDDEELCIAASLCRSLHFTFLDEVFRRNQTLIPTPLSFPAQVPMRDYAVVRPTPGICINIDTSISLTALRSLCLTSPSFFHNRPVTAVVGKLYGPSQLNQALKMLGQFLVSHPGAATIEAVVLDFGNITDRLHSWDPIMVRAFLRIFNGDGALNMPKCISLTLTGGSHWHPCKGEFYSIPRLHRDFKGSNTIQTLFAMAPRLCHASRYGPSSSVTRGLVMFNLDTTFVDQIDKHSSWTVNLLARNSTSLRSLSITKWSLWWGYLFAHATLPNLEELYVSGSSVSISFVANFLSRHRKLRLLAMWNLYAGRWSPPPFFLPNLTTLVIPPLFFSLMMKSRMGIKPLPNLRDVTFWLYLSKFHPRAQQSLLDKAILGLDVNDYTTQRLRTLRLGLRLRIESDNLDWVKDSYGISTHPDQAFICHQLMFLQIELPRFCSRYTNESKDVRLHFPGWLQLFPHIESVEIWSNPMDRVNSEDWNESAPLAQALNPSLRFFWVDGIRVL